MFQVLHLHSYLRFAVLLAGAFALAVYGYGLATRSPYTRLHRISGAIYSGLLQLQVLVGFVAVALGRVYGQLIGHAVLMVAAAAVLQITLSTNRRRTPPSLRAPTFAIALSLLLIVAGVAAINRSLWVVTVP